MGRKKFYESVDEMQPDLDAYLIRIRPGQRLRGRVMRSNLIAGTRAGYRWIGLDHFARPRRLRLETAP